MRTPIFESMFFAWFSFKFSFTTIRTGFIGSKTDLAGNRSIL